MKPKMLNAFTRTLFVVYILLLAGVILFKLPFYSPTLSDGVRVINIIPFQGSYDENGALLFREIIYNVLVFAPLGIYICMVKNEWSFMRKVLPIIGLSLAFEVIQFTFAMGRSDMTDVLANTLGGMIGIGIYGLLFKALGNRTAKIVNVLALIVTAYVVVRFAHLFYLSHFAMMRP